MTNIADALSATKNTKAVLLENQACWRSASNPAAAARANLIVEEAAQMAIFAEVLGGAKNIPPGAAQSHGRVAETNSPAQASKGRNKFIRAYFR